MWIRGKSILGLFNTITGILFNMVLVKVVDDETGKTLKYYWDKAENHPKSKE